jgi:hypothetical protein
MDKISFGNDKIMIRLNAVRNDVGGRPVLSRTGTLRGIG